ncbi:unnamed protein product [Spirodela intermedia]|uniref:Uncharacterized protein n=1 Tax=Spirodela intermedia TaxID=51605 RepID=A0A7I8KNI7_SPIIN|nr:unnamed protein product [Spirodela intermedia]
MWDKLYCSFGARRSIDLMMDIFNNFIKLCGMSSPWHSTYLTLTKLGNLLDQYYLLHCYDIDILVM